MINLDSLENWIFNYIDSNVSNPSIIYIGVGTYFSPVYKTGTSNKYWNYDENQQFPPFLHDFKSSNIDIPVLVVLIDPAFNTSDFSYIVNFQDQFYSGSWEESKEYSNIHYSTLGINVIVIPEKVIWKENLHEEPESFDFANFLVNVCNKVSSSNPSSSSSSSSNPGSTLTSNPNPNPNSNTLLFYHEFTGSNPRILEQIVKKNAIDYDPNKICIDITRGADMSCYFNLSNPEFYPVISLDSSNKLKYVNPLMLSSDEKTNIILKYKKFTKGFDVQDSGCEYYASKPNYLFATNSDIILCFQIIKFDKMIINIISNGLIPMIRYLYICTNDSNINSKIWGTTHLMHLTYLTNELNSIHNFDFTNKIPIPITNQIEKIQEDLNLIELINLNILSNPDHFTTILYLKESVICKLFNLIKNILENIFNKYKINPNVINDFIDNLKQLHNKYDMIPLYKNFIENLIN